MKRLPPRCLFWILWLIFFVAGSYVLRFGYGERFFAYPAPGTDQKSILECALGLVRGELPRGHCLYSYAYTLFLAFLALLSGGRLWLMRLLQLAVAALIPGIVFRTARILRCGRASLLRRRSAPVLLCAACRSSPESAPRSAPSAPYCAAANAPSE